MKLFNIVTYALFSLSIACNLTSASSHSFAKSFERKEIAYLEQRYAAARKKQISDLSYQLHVELDENSTSFTGDVTINFTLQKNNKMPVTIDFDGGEIVTVVLNGKAVAWDYNKWFIRLAPQLFAEEKNTLQIRYTRTYATAGDGLHRYKDKESGKVYLYSNFEPFNAHKMFPHFDQPDLKATYTLDVIAPQHWQVISTTRETQILPQGDKKHWQFAPTPLMASYVFSLHAGPYTKWEDNSGAIPLRLFARQEMAQYVDSKEWFLFTQQAFSFFNHYFDYAYPFAKYDQLIVPDFNSGAMENIAAVTFNENFISRSKKTYQQRMRTNNVISHEMAHMWFGDLVTMDWWNGLWLNESFATYMATLQQANNSEFKNDAWNTFYSDMKQWAYTTDLQVTSHPIELPVANTSEAFTNFDGITYGKGASVLKQLAVFVGEEKFRQGVSTYLKKYSYSNTHLKNFMDEVAGAAKQNLSGWSKEWLYKAGLNTVSVDYQCEGEGAQAKIKRLDIVQLAAPKNPVWRHQRIQLGLYNVQQEKISPIKIIPVYYQSAKTRVREAEGLACPRFVYPNVGDWGYVKVELDKTSRQALTEHLSEFDTSMRKMLWQNMWDDVDDIKLSLTDYVQFVQKNIQDETDFQQAASVLQRLQTASYYFWLFTKAGQDHSQDLLNLENVALQELNRAPAASDYQKSSFDTYAVLAHTPEALERLRNYLVDKKVPEGFVLDQDRRWAILRRLNQFQYKDYRELTTIEQQNDKSDIGQQMAIVCEVIRPEPAVKEKWFAELLAANSPYKYATMRMVLKAIFPANQLELRALFDERILKILPELQSRNNDRFLSAYADSLTNPHLCTLASVQRLTEIRNQYTNLNPALDKILSTNVQEEQRCVDMMQLMNPK